MKTNLLHVPYKLFKTKMDSSFHITFLNHSLCSNLTSWGKDPGIFKVGKWSGGLVDCKVHGRFTWLYSYKWEHRTERHLQTNSVFPLKWRQAKWSTVRCIIMRKQCVLEDSEGVGSHGSCTPPPLNLKKK